MPVVSSSEAMPEAAVRYAAGSAELVAAWAGHVLRPHFYSCLEALWVAAASGALPPHAASGKPRQAVVVHIVVLALIDCMEVIGDGGVLFHTEVRAPRHA